MRPADSAGIINTCFVDPLLRQLTCIHPTAICLDIVLSERHSLLEECSCSVADARGFHLLLLLLLHGPYLLHCALPDVKSQHTESLASQKP
jgi:hypothetical protein